MAMHALVEGWRASSINVKLGVAGCLVVVAAILIIGTQGIVSHYKDRKFDKKQTELKAQSDEHRKRADEAEAKARALETDVKISQLAVEAAGAKVAEKQELLKQEDARATEDLQNAGQEVDAAERCRRLCARAIKLKLIAANADCGCVP